MSRFKVLVTNSNVPKIAFDLLRNRCDVIVNEELPVPTRSDILAKCPGVDAIFWITKEKLDAEVLDAAGPQMKTVASMSVGVDHIDVGELRRRGIQLGNTPSVLNNAVAETAVMLALAAGRRLHEGRLKIERDEWVPSVDWMLGQELTDSTVGIIGLGQLGQVIAKRFRAFDVGRIVYTGHKEKEEGKALAAEFVSLDVLAGDSDFVIVSCPLTSETRHMIDAGFFSKMKKTAVFVNVGRGDIVKQEDLVAALKNGAIFAAGLDVMTPEPLPKDHELLKLPNCVVFPHLGSATYKTRSAMAELTARNILNALEGKEMLAKVI